MDGFTCLRSPYATHSEFPRFVVDSGSPWLTMKFPVQTWQIHKNQIFCLESRLAGAGVFLTRPRFFGEGSGCVGVWWLVVDMKMCQNLGHGKSQWDTVSFWFQFGLRRPHVAKTYCFFGGVVTNDAGVPIISACFTMLQSFIRDFTIRQQPYMYNHWNSWQPQLESHKTCA